MGGAFTSKCANMHTLENGNRINSKSVKLGKGREQVEDKGKNSVTTTQSN